AGMVIGTGTVGSPAGIFCNWFSSNIYCLRITISTEKKRRRTIHLWLCVNQRAGDPWNDAAKECEGCRFGRAPGNEKDIVRPEHGIRLLPVQNARQVDRLFDAVAGLIPSDNNRVLADGRS